MQSLRKRPDMIFQKDKRQFLIHIVLCAFAPLRDINSCIRHPAAALALAAALCCAGMASAKEGESELFDFYSLEFTGTRHDRVIEDMDGDGKADLGMLFSRSDVSDKYWFRSCLQSGEGVFSNECSVVDVPPQARVFDLGEMDHDKGAELVLLTPSGISYASFKGDNFRGFSKARKISTLLQDTERGQPALLRFLWDLDKDGRDEIVLPTVKGPVIYKFREKEFVELTRIKSPARTTYRVGSLGDITHTDDLNQFLLFKTYQKRTSAKYTAPDVFITDFNGDRKMDIVTLIDNTLRVFPQKEDGSFATQPRVTEHRSILTPEEKGGGFAGEGMTHADLNGDGLGDIIMMKWGTSDERTRMDRYIYYARPGLEYKDEPDQIIRSESAAVDFGIHDLNRDGRLDMVIPFFHFAPAQAFKVMTENAVKIQFRIFLMRPGGRYSQDPGKTFAKVDKRILLNYRINVLGMIFDLKTLIEGKFRPLISFGHDVNGDGYPDLIADTGKDKIEFYWGNEEVEFPRRPDHVIEFESATDFDIKDVNNDGKADLVTFYGSEERTRKKRELARKAREQGEPVFEMDEEAALADAPEGTRVKMLISR